MSCVPLRRWCVLKDDWHEGLANDALPRLGHLTPNATVGSYLAGGGRGLGKSLGIARGQSWKGVGVLPYKVAHAACDELEAVRICAWGDKSEVASRTHLQDLRQRDLLQGPTSNASLKKRLHSSNK